MKKRRKNITKKPYVIQLQTMSGFLYPQAEEKGLKIGKLLISIYMYINKLCVQIIFVSLYTYCKTVPTPSIHITDVDADLHAILNTIADKVQTHFANNKVIKEENKSKPIASNPKPQK